MRGDESDDEHDENEENEDEDHEPILSIANGIHLLALHVMERSETSSQVFGTWIYKANGILLLVHTFHDYDSGSGLFRQQLNEGMK